MFKIFIVAIMLCSITVTKAQTCNVVLQGKISDFHDGENLSGASIYVKQLGKTVFTNNSGSYRIDMLCPGDYELYVSHISCDSKSIKVSVQDDLTYNISLEHHINDLDQVSLIQNIHTSDNQTSSTVRLNTETIEKYSGATLGDALASANGVTSLKTGAAVVKPVIHGLHSSRVIIVNDNMRQQDQEWGIEHAPNIDINTASSINVIKGASALRYGGDAVGGTIIIEPARALSIDTLQGRVIAQGQTNGRGGSVTGLVERYRASGWYQQATGTYKKLGDFTAPDYVLSNTGNSTAAASVAVGFKQFDKGLLFKYSFYNATLGILRASHVGSASDLVRSINSGVPNFINDFTYDIDAPRQEVTHHSIAASGFKRFKALGKLQFDYGLQFNNRKEFDVRRGENRGRASLDIDLITQTTSAYLQIDAPEKTTVEIGVDGLVQTNAPNAATGIRRLIPDYNSYKLGLFASVNHNLNETLLFDAGLRYDYFNIDAQKFYFLSRWQQLGYDQQYPQFERRLDGNQILTNPQLDYNLYAATAGLRKKFSEQSDLSFNLSIANRAPNAGELFSDGLHQALATIELGKLDLKVERSLKFNTVFHTGSDHWELEINPYIMLVDNFTQLIPTGLEVTTRGAFPVYQYEQVRSRLYGLDISGTYQFNKKDQVNETWLTLKSNLAFVNGTAIDRNEALFEMPPLQIQTTALFQDVIKSNIDFELSHQFVAKQNRFPNNNYTVEFQDDQGNLNTELVNISETPDAYHLWNLSATYKHKNYEWRLNGQNIFNTRYRNNLNRQRFYADDLGVNVQLQLIYRF